MLIVGLTGGIGCGKSLVSDLFHDQFNTPIVDADVIAKQLTNGDQLNTEELFWDEANELIYSNTFTRIQNQDGTFYGKNGFESHQSLDNWQLKGSSGIVNVRDDE